jgi:hypothetical protein
MTLNWIAKRFNKGAAGFLANLLREARRKRKYPVTRDPVYNSKHFEPGDRFERLWIPVLKDDI